MGRYLNSSTPYALYQGETNQPYFVDNHYYWQNCFLFWMQAISIFVLQDQGVLEKRSWPI